MLNSLMLEVLAQADGLDVKKGRERLPVWLMRQAGRYMPSYQKIRKDYTLHQMFHEPELITKVTLLPIDELHVDAAIVFSDILLILEALGISVSYGEGGVSVATLEGLDDVRLIQPVEAIMAQFEYLSTAMKELKSTLKVPLMGFVGAPFTLACYALDGSKAALATKVRKALWSDRVAFETLQRRLSDYLFALAKLQVDSGAQILQIFDSHTHVLSQEEYALDVMPVLSGFLSRLRTLKVPVVYFSRTSQLFSKQLEKLPVSVLGIDWQSDMSFFSQHSKRILQGNFNPWKLLNDPSTWQEELKGFLKAHHNGRTICSLGHGVLPQTPWHHVKAFVDTVLAFKE